MFSSRIFTCRIQEMVSQLVTAMRHFQPEALALVVSDYPDVQMAMTAILLQADEVLVKPFKVEQLVPLIDKKKLTSKSLPRPVKENVASILDRVRCDHHRKVVVTSGTGRRIDFSSADRERMHRVSS